MDYFDLQRIQQKRISVRDGMTVLRNRTEITFLRFLHKYIYNAFLWPHVGTWMANTIISYVVFIFVILTSMTLNDLICLFISTMQIFLRYAMQPQFNFLNSKTILTTNVNSCMIWYLILWFQSCSIYASELPSVSSMSNSSLSTSKLMLLLSSALSLHLSSSVTSNRLAADEYP